MYKTCKKSKEREKENKRKSNIKIKRKMRKNLENVTKLTENEKTLRKT